MDIELLGRIVALEAMVAELTARLAEVELTLRAHRSDLVREQWRGKEVALHQACEHVLAGAVEERQERAQTMVSRHLGR